MYINFVISSLSSRLLHLVWKHILKIFARVAPFFISIFQFHFQRIFSWKHEYILSFLCSQISSSFFIFFLYLLHPSERVSRSTVFTNHNLISVRHRKYRLIILLYLHVISCSSTWNLASSRDPEPRPSLESSNHSGFDLMAASIVESDLVFG